MTSASRPYFVSARSKSAVHRSAPSVSRPSVTATAPAIFALASWTSSTTASIQTRGSGPGKSSLAEACSSDAYAKSASSQPPATDSMLMAMTFAPAPRSSVDTRLMSGISYSWTPIALSAAGTFLLNSATTPSAPRFWRLSRRRTSPKPGASRPLALSAFMALTTGSSSSRDSRNFFCFASCALRCSTARPPGAAASGATGVDRRAGARYAAAQAAVVARSARRTSAMFAVRSSLAL
mmetsp:Transcript_26/g.92  ORF Transcript_26/g.92 Transcript_26/m.92 type:complete len:237 (+) Transcript_26:448-1158(+)